MKLEQNKRHWAVAGLYLLLALALTWPLAPRIFSHLPNLLSLGAGDTNMFVWLMDWAAQALTDNSALRVVGYLRSGPWGWQTATPEVLAEDIARGWRRN